MKTKLCVSCREKMLERYSVCPRCGCWPQSEQGAKDMREIAENMKARRSKSECHCPHCNGKCQTLENAGEREHGYTVGRAYATTVHDGNGNVTKNR